MKVFPYFQKKGAGLVALFLFFFQQNVVFAQDPLFDEGTELWETETFIDDSNADQDPNIPDAIRELEEGGDTYYTDEEIFRFQQQYYQQNAQRINYDQALQETSATLQDNVIYGIGTGLVIGTWFAVFAGGDARANFRLLGSGAVLGGLMGFLIGTKAFYIVPPKKINGGTPQNGQQDIYGFESSMRNKKIEAQSNSPIALGYRIDF